MGSRPRLQVVADRRSVEMRRAIGADFRANRVDQGVSQQRLADAIGVDRGHVARIEAGAAAASLGVLQRIAAGLGGDLSVRFYPGTGSMLRDRIQAAIVEGLVRSLGPMWRSSVEVAVYPPARGVIDLVVARSDDPTVVAVEVHSQIRRLEQLLRWTTLKRESLPSSEWWEVVAPESVERVSSLLVIASTTANRRVIAEHAATVTAAYPAPTADAVASFTSGDRWPGDTLLWADVRGGVASIRAAPPRGIEVGRLSSRAGR